MKTQYRTPVGWEVVKLNDYFERIGMDTFKAYHGMDDMIQWCKRNIAEDSWWQDGVTIFSFRFAFKDQIDVTAFKLRFGI